MNIQSLHIDSADLRKLFGTASGDAALLYLFIRSGNAPELAVEQLHFTSTRFSCAAATLRQLGLWPEENRRAVAPGERPQYSEKDVLAAMDQEQSFRLLRGEVQRLLGRNLNTEDLKILLGFVHYLGLPTEVISVLVSFCKDRARLRGNLRSPSLRTIEKEAYHWADLGIDTLDEASAYMQLELERHTKMGAIRKAMHLEGRKLTTAEERMLHQWLDWGFGQSEIVLAYEKTCMNTGSMKWPYMNSILSRWHDQGLMTVDAIHAGDKSPGKAAQPVQSEPSQFMKDAVARMLRQETQPSKPIRED